LGETAHSQSLSAFEQALAFPLSLQMPPGTWLPWFCTHTPKLMLPEAVVAGTQLTSGLVPLPPQHSASLVQRLFRILQPSPGWQTLTPVRAHGPQLRLQQLPQPLQSTPSCTQDPAPVVATSWQTPRVAPLAIAHEPPQQSVSRAQTSPGWMQNEAPSAQVPPEQSPEQQSPAALQGLPAVLQVAFSGAQVPPLQLPLQQAADDEQAAPSATHMAAVAHTPRAVSHCRLQQSVATAHELPDPLQVATDALQVLETGSHACEQHCASLLQAAAVTVQMTLFPPLPPVPPLMAFTVLLPQPASATAIAATASVR
jgi:hypothetical protein